MEKCNHHLGFNLIEVEEYASKVKFVSLLEKIKDKDVSYTFEFDFCPKCGTKLLDETGRLLLDRLL